MADGSGPSSQKNPSGEGDVLSLGVESAPGVLVRRPLPEVLRLKCELFARGLRVSDGAWRLLRDQGALLPRRMRSGTSGGLFLHIAPQIAVDCPVSEKFVDHRPLELRHESGLHIVTDTGEPWPVAPTRRPRWYDKLLSDSTPAFGVGQVCGDRLTISLSKQCALWCDPALRCTFCSLGLNQREEASGRTAEQLDEVIALVLQDQAHPVRHLLLGGGTRDLDDYGYAALTETAAAISRTFPLLPIGAMTVPPRRGSGAFERLLDAGISEMAINIELWSSKALRCYVPGKTLHFGREGYLEALERAARVFGAWQVRSLIIVGLEPIEQTLVAVRALADIGVVPVLSPLRPLRGTALEDRRPPEAALLVEVHDQALEICVYAGTGLGPVCPGCHGNTLTVHGLSDQVPLSSAR